MNEERHDPITGEVLEAGQAPSTAADGRPLFPICSTASQFIAMLEEGQFDRDSGDKLRQLVSSLREAAIAGAGKAKGSVTIKLDVTLEGDTFMITPQATLKVPAEKRARTVAWATEDGRFTPNKPHQGQMYGIRNAGGALPLRNQG